MNTKLLFSLLISVTFERKAKVPESEEACELEFSGNCFVAMDEELGAHRFVYAIAPPQYAEAYFKGSACGEDMVRTYAREMEQCIRAHYAKSDGALLRRIGPIWKDVSLNGTSESTGAASAAEFLNDLIRSKSIKELYEIAATYGPLGLISDDGLRGHSRFMSRYFYVRPFDENRFAPPSVADLLCETRYMSLASSREYPGVTKKIVDPSGFDRKLAFTKHCSALSLSEPVADWVLLRNLLQAVGRIQSGELGAGTVIEADFACFPRYMRSMGRSLLNEELDVYTDEGEPNKSLWNRSRRHWYVERIGAMCPESLEGAQEALGSTSISSEDGTFSKSSRGELRQRSQAAEAWFMHHYPAFCEVFRSYASFVPLDGQGTLALDLASQRIDLYERRSGSPGERPATMHLLFGCQSYAKLLREKFGFSFDKEDGIYLVVDCPALHGVEDTRDEMEDAIRAGTISGLYYHVLGNCQLDFNAMLELTRRDELGPGEVSYAPRTLMDKAIFALLGHRGRKLIVCKNCGRISLAPAQGKPRQFCSASCQHMYAKKNAK